MMQFESGEEVELVLKTEKESQTGIFSNERLLMIKAGIISYFSNVPPKFGGSARAIELSGQMPKFTIPANDVDQMELKGNMLSLLFRKAKLISKEDFTRLVSDGQKSEKTPSLSLREENNGYEKWIFKCQNVEMMQQFYYLANLFRSKNPRFTPNLSALISSYQTGKKGKARQMSMNPNEGKGKTMAQQRMTDVPIANSGRDSLTEAFIREEAQREVKPVEVKINARPVSGRISIPQPYNQEALKINEEKERLLRVKSKIQSANQPNMGTIDEKNDEDKVSEMSKVRDNILTSKIDIKHTYSMLVDENKEEKQEVKEEKKEEKIEQPLVIETKKQEEPIVPAVQEKIPEQVKVAQPIEEVKPLIVEEEKKVQQIVVDLSLPEPQPQIINSQIPSPSPPQIIQPPIHSQPLPPIPENHRPMRKKKQIDQSFSSSIYDSEYRHHEEAKQRQRKKISHLLRSSLASNPNIFPQLSKQYDISEEQLQQLMKEYSNEEDSCWNYIENTLALILAKGNGEIPPNGGKLQVSDGLIEHYHKLGGDFDTDNDEFSPLEGEMSFESYVESNQDEQEALQWMEGEILSHNPKPFSSKTLNKSHFKIQIKAFSFKQADLICVKDGWILNKNGKLQEFLAYLRLQKVLKEIRSGLKGEIQLTCAQAIYLRFKQYQGLAKQWRMDSSCSPLKSIKALQFIHRCKDMKMFSKQYPQFTIIAETIREGHSYRLHLDRISSATIVPPLQRELKRIVFPYDNEIDEFYSTLQYKQIEKRCLMEIDKLLTAKTRIQEGDLQIYVNNLNNNLQVDTLCKLLSCRIDRKGAIYFHPTVLRLGGRQFGEEIALIRRSRKKGSFEIAREVSKKVMSRLQYYRNVTPMSHFIQINLEVVDLMVVERGELHRAVPILLKVLAHLNGCEIEQYSVYLSLMKTFLKLNELPNFIKTLQNCRLFLSLMFKENALLFDYSFQRTIILLLLHQDTNRAHQLNLGLLAQLKQSAHLNDTVRRRLVSEVVWDRSNILISQGKVEQAYNCCEQYLLTLEEGVSYIQDYWVEGVLCSARGWLEMETPTTKSTAHLQKRILVALQYAFSRQNTEIIFILYHTGEKILEKCQELSLPCMLQYQPSYEQARIQFNEVQSELLRLAQG